MDSVGILFLLRGCSRLLSQEHVPAFAQGSSGLPLLVFWTLCTAGTLTWDLAYAKHASNPLSFAYFSQRKLFFNTTIIKN